MAQKPLFLTKSDIVTFYKVDAEQAAEVVKDLEPTGVYMLRDNNLYARPDVEKALKKEGLL